MVQDGTHQGLRETTPRHLHYDELPREFSNWPFTPGASYGAPSVVFTCPLS